MDSQENQESTVETPTSLSDLAKQDQEKAQRLGDQIDRCMKLIHEMDEDIATIMRSQDYYRKKMRKLAKRRDICLNMRLL